MFYQISFLNTSTHLLSIALNHSVIFISVAQKHVELNVAMSILGYMLVSILIHLAFEYKGCYFTEIVKLCSLTPPGDN